MNHLIRWHVWVRASGATAEEIRRWFPPLKRSPLVLTNQAGKDSIVEYASADAMAAGIHPGILIETARMRSPSLRAVATPAGIRDTILRRISTELDLQTTMPCADEFYSSLESTESPESLPSRIKHWFGKWTDVSISLAVSTSRNTARIAASAPDMVPAIIPRGEERELLGTVPLTRLTWLNPEGIRTLAREWAVFTVGDLAMMPPPLVRSLLGTSGLRIQDSGSHTDTVRIDTIRKRIELADPCNDFTTLRRHLLHACDTAWTGMWRMGTSVRRIELSMTPIGGRPRRVNRRLDPELEDPVSLGRIMMSMARTLKTRKSIRMIEIALVPGSPAGIQLPLFSEMGVFRRARLGTALGRLEERYGTDTIVRACTMGMPS